MGYGIKILNDNNEVQVDGEYRNFSEVESDTNVTINSYPELISITNTSLVPVIAIRPDTDSFINLFSYVYSSPNYTDFNVIGGIEGPYDPSYGVPPVVISTTVDWIAYTETPSKSTETHGLRIYNSDTDLVFDSGKKYFDIVQVDQIILDDPTHVGAVWNRPYEDITHSSIENPYYILSPNGFWWISGMVEPGKFAYIIFRIGLKQISSTSVRVGRFWYDGGWCGGAASTGYNPTCNLITCNVR